MSETVITSESSLLVTLDEIGQLLSTNGRPTESLQSIVTLLREHSEPTSAPSTFWSRIASI